MRQKASARAMRAESYSGKFTGTIADFGVYSFNGNKIITSGGGGAIVTNNKVMAKKVKYLINQQRMIR